MIHKYASCEIIEDYCCRSGSLYDYRWRDYHYVMLRERDDALEHVEMYKQRLQEQQALEEAAYQQVKKGIEMTEASEFELTQVQGDAVKLLKS